MSAFVIRIFLLSDQEKLLNFFIVVILSSYWQRWVQDSLKPVNTEIVNSFKSLLNNHVLG